MSSNDGQLSNETSDDSDEISNKFVLKTTEDLKDYAKEDLLHYIDGLHQLIKNYEKQLTKYKYMVKDLEETESSENKTETEETKCNWQNDDDNASSFSDKSIAATNDAFNFVKEMRQAALQAQNVNNFIYEPTSGLYYDQKSGYYYNAECGLYYDGNTGCYYRYNDERQSYEFYSQVGVQPTRITSKLQDNDLIDAEVIFDEHGVVTDIEKLKRLRLERAKEQKTKEYHKTKKLRHQEPENHKDKKNSLKRLRLYKEEKKVEGTLNPKYEMEDGELSDSSTSSTNSSQHISSSNDEENDGKYGREDQMKNEVPAYKKGIFFQDLAKNYPPSLRIIVQETNLKNLKVGNLSLVTYKGGTLGREGNHDVIVPDINVSKCHLKFTYDEKKSLYKCIDLGSRNGTILNGQRMSVSKKESSAFDLIHGSILQIAQTKLLCHIHEGNSTCSLCEPGLLINRSPGLHILTTALSRKEQLKRLQKKYGLENEKFVDNIKQQTVGSYSDRAAKRRSDVGSSNDKEKTQTASMDTEIPSNNKGFKILSKLGWNKGDALGKSTQNGGILEPINVESNPGTKGLGCKDDSFIIMSDKKKLKLIEKTKQRYLDADIVRVDP